MTNEDAIRSIERHMIAHRMGKYPHILIKEALEMAITALRAQKTPAKLDRSRWEGCKLCDEPTIVGFTTYCGYQYCKNCGRPLTEESWAELKRRIGGNDGTANCV